MLQAVLQYMDYESKERQHFFWWLKFFLTFCVIYQLDKRQHGVILFPFCRNNVFIDYALNSIFRYYIISRSITEKSQSIWLVRWLKQTAFCTFVAHSYEVIYLKLWISIMLMGVKPNKFIDCLLPFQYPLLWKVNLL